MVFRWKSDEKRTAHWNKRRTRGHIPNDFMVDDYEEFIISLINGNENEIYL